YMKLALDEAWKYQGLTYPNPAVGCTIVGGRGEILAVEAHKRAGEPHAEVEALKSAYLKLTNDEKILGANSSSDIHTYLLTNHNNCFNDISLFTTLEPCSHIGKTPSCATLIADLGIKKIFVGSKDSNKEASGGNEILKKANVYVQTDVLLNKCEELLTPFKMWSEKRFVFFKWAQRLNGTLDNGVISSIKSRTLVHAMRDVCDLLVIGGSTVRTDRPTLDARLVGGRAPDVLILSKTKEFDQTIPLFGVKNRKVMIMDNFSIFDNYKNIMIEGGDTMFEYSKGFATHYLSFIAPCFGGSKSIAAEKSKFDVLNILQDEQDIIMWMKQADNRGSN
ncbi:MAG: diaminohydroxyphosphoribosylaminopyrimidine deaminase, partial [Campylobacterota bacterium]|nr:diaminohydroxyphosphoribosylaminopyrimidine deaminase [Campylobacterota bacterium]